MKLRLAMKLGKVVPALGVSCPTQWKQTTRTRAYRRILKSLNRTHRPHALGPSAYIVVDTDLHTKGLEDLEG